MELADLDLNKTYTYADYLKWQFQDRVELIKGRIFKMSPAPNYGHQAISMNFSGQLWSYLRGKTCRVVTAPFDIRLAQKTAKDEEITTVVQPDICVICDSSEIDNRGYYTGVPEIVVEILSPSNNKKELKNKYELYEEAGVKEYWIVLPPEKAVQIFTLKEGKYVGSKYMYPGDEPMSSVITGFSLDIGQLFS